MASLTFSYNSPKQRAKIEARLTFTVEGKRVSCYGRIPIEVDQDFWSAYSKSTKFREVDKVNLKTKIDNETAAIREYVLNWKIRTN